MAKKSTPLASHDDRLKEFLPVGTNFNDVVWLHKQSGMRIVKHKYLKQIAGLQQIRVVPESVRLDFFAERNKCICFVMVETKDKQTYCSVAEADPANNKNAYPAMMAYKRAVDRAILEALNLQGFFYSESEIALTDNEAEAAQRRSDDALKETEPTPEAQIVKAQLEQKPIGRNINDLIDGIKATTSLDDCKTYLAEMANADDFKALSDDDKEKLRVISRLTLNSFKNPIAA